MATQRTTEALVFERYKLEQVIGSGSFGEMRQGKDVYNGQLVAIKLELIREGKSTPLAEEYRYYQMLPKGVDGFPEIYRYGRYFKYNALVMELLGRNLESVFVQCSRQFSLKTIIYIFIQLLQRIEKVHSANLIYRDVKPENFVLGREGSRQENIIHIVDFGLAKQYYYPNSQSHISMTEGRPLTGTARYMSINSHLGREQSRRDDLESIGYMMLYFIKQAKLPWSGLQADTLKERYKRIGLVKRSTSIESLCFGYPEQFAEYFRTVRALQFEEKPDYIKLKTMFIRLFQKERFEDDGYYDWNQL